MSFQITYSRLAAINILHNFYLDNEDSPYYGLSPADQEARLASQLQDDRFNLMNDILVKATPATERILKGQKIVFRQTATGIILGISSVEGVLPTIPINGQLRLQFIIQLKNKGLLSRSNLKVNPVFPACYYFTNDSTTTKIFPSLSATIQDVAEGRIYEMGEWAIVNGHVSQAVTRTNTAATG